MLGVAQSAMALVTGGVLILVLTWILIQVHKQANHIKDIERQLDIIEKAKEKEALKNG